MILALALLLLGGPARAQDPNQELFRAIRRRDIAAVQRLLSRGADPNAKDVRGEPALNEAILSSGRRLSDMQSVASQSAAASGHEVLKALLDRGANPNAADENGATPILRACGFMNLSRADVAEIVFLLVAHGAGVNARAKNGEAPLLCMVRHDRPEAMKILLDKGADISASQYDETPLIAAVREGREGHLEAVKLLLAHGANPHETNKYGISVLDLAARLKRPAILQALLTKSNGADPEALIAAAERGDAESVRLLLAHGADPMAKEKRWGITALCAAADKGQEQVVKVLLEARADPNAADGQGRTPLAIAAGKGHAEVVRLLLAKGAQVDAKGHFGSTALTAAVENGHEDVARLLLAAGPDMEDRFTGNWRALFKTAEKGSASLAALMLERGAKVDMRDELDRTPLMVAAEAGRTEVAGLLLDKGAKIEAVNERRPPSDVGDNFIGTPLMWAAARGQTEMVALLLKRGANPRARNPWGMTVLQAAKGHEDIVRVLQAAGAQ